VSGNATERVRRRLAAILVAGYGRLLPGDEVDSFTSLTLLMTEIIEPLTREFSGDIFKRTGDQVLVEFDSVVEAGRCAAALCEAIAQLNQALLPNRRVALRIGLNLDDVILQDGDIFGDGVNVAARLQSVAEPGTIYVSEGVRDRLTGRVDFDFEDLGPKALKNIAAPIRVYRMGGKIAKEAFAFGNSDAVTTVSTPSFDDRRAIAVLPFSNFGGDPEQEYFADGITEDIITMLAGWRAFPVISRNSTFTYKGRTIDLEQVGEELGVRYVLEGSVRKSGHRVRVTAQLIDADTRLHLMAEKYDRDLTDLFELQDEIVIAIAGAIEPELLKFERNRIASRPQQSEDAYELYQRGLWHHYRHTKEDNAVAQIFFQRALAIDPKYPQATASLAIAVCNAAYLGWAEVPERNYVEASELAQLALSSDARNPMAHFALGLVCMFTRRSDRAMKAFQEAIKLDPSSAAAYVLLGQMYLYSGRPKEAISLAERGIRLSPSDPRLFIWLPALAGAHYQLRQYAQAVEIGRRAWALNRHWPAGLRYVVAGLGQLGHISEAQTALVDLKSLDGRLDFVEDILARVYSDRPGIDHFLEGLRKAGFA
jgi:adenylate cyclase